MLLEDLLVVQETNVLCNSLGKTVIPVTVCTDDFGEEVSGDVKACLVYDANDEPYMVLYQENKMLVVYSPKAPRVALLSLCKSEVGWKVYTRNKPFLDLSLTSLMDFGKNMRSILSI